MVLTDCGISEEQNITNNEQIIDCSALQRIKIVIGKYIFLSSSMKYTFKLIEVAIKIQ